MNRKELADSLRALSLCRPECRTRGLGRGVERLGGAGRWELGVFSGAAFDAVEARYFGAGGEFPGFCRAARRSLGAPRPPGPLPPPEGFPWLSLRWDLRSDEPAGVRVFARAGADGRARSAQAGGGLLLHSPKPFSPAWFKAPALKALFSDCAALWPIRDMVSEWEVAGAGALRPRPRWSVRLERPVPWPAFVCLQLSDPFLPAASPLAFLLLNRSVREISFQEAELCAFVGA